MHIYTHIGCVLVHSFIIEDNDQFSQENSTGMDSFTWIYNYCTGPAPPIAAMELFHTNITSDSATVHWTVLSLAYDPETYRLLCGTDPNVLILQAPSVTSDANIEATNIRLSLTTEGLRQQTFYYCEVRSSNSFGRTLSDGQTSFTTQASNGELSQSNIYI